MKEEVVVDHIERSLKYKNRYYVNVHGSIYSQNGTPDIITSDKNGQFMCIEVKAPKQQPKINQWRHVILNLKSNNNSRAIIAYEDFDIDKVDNEDIPKVKIGQIIGESEYNMLSTQLNCTTELIFDD